MSFAFLGLSVDRKKPHSSSIWYDFLVFVCGLVRSEKRWQPSRPIPSLPAILQGRLGTYNIVSYFTNNAQVLLLTPPNYYISIVTGFLPFQIIDEILTINGGCSFNLPGRMDTCRLKTTMSRQVRTTAIIGDFMPMSTYNFWGRNCTCSQQIALTHNFFRPKSPVLHRIAHPLHPAP